MDTMDIRIGAVFSLAPTHPDETPTNDLASHTDDPGDEDEGYFIPFDGPNSSSTYFGGGDSIRDDVSLNASTVSAVSLTASTESAMSLNASTETAISEETDGDCPPSLSMELSPTVAPPSRTWHMDDVMPPVLEREKPEVLETATPGKGHAIQLTDTGTKAKRKCTRIFPSYLVLTNAKRELGAKNRISYRRFKRTFKECTNMCKKIHFRRRLDSGKDVFNVKSPSKQKPFHSYVTPAGTNVEPKKDMDYVSLLAFHDKLNAKKFKDSGKKQSVTRKRRMIQYIPKDFQMKTLDVCGVTEEEEEEEKHNLEKLKEERHQQLLKEIHKQELVSLKHQIKMKRLTNKRYKSIKKMESVKTVVDYASGTSMKGRKRKFNSRYGPEFALTKAEEDQCTAMARLEKLMEKDRKRNEDHLNNLKNRIGAKDKDKRGILIVIDNPEKNQVKKLKLARMIPEPKIKSEDETKKSGSKKLKAPRPKQSTASTDGVLIRDLPAEDMLINGILGNSEPQAPLPLQASPLVTDASAHPKSDCIDPYTYAKSLLKSSLFANNENGKSGSEIQNLLMKPKTLLMTPDMEKDKAKKLRIPENVQRLFKVKTEPVDPDEVTVSSLNMLPNARHTFSKPTVSNTVHTSMMTETRPQPLTKTPTTYSMFSSNVSGTPTSSNTTMVIPSAIRQPAPQIIKSARQISQANRMPIPITIPYNIRQSVPTTKTSTTQLSSANRMAIPVSIPSGIRGDKVFTCTVLVSPPSSTANKVQVSNVPVTNRSQSPKTLGSQRAISTVFPNPVSVMVQSSAMLPSKPDITMCANMPSFVQGVGNVMPVSSAKTNLQTTGNPGFKTMFTNQFVTVSNAPPGLPKFVQAHATMSHMSVTSGYVTTQQKTPQVTSAATPLTQTTNVLDNKCKFYLLKVDGKHILIPMNHNQSASPTAFVVSNEVAQKAANISAVGPPMQNLTTSKQATPITKLAVSTLATQTTSPKATKIIIKPTATIPPSVKPSLGDSKAKQPMASILQARASFKTAIASNIVNTAGGMPDFDIGNVVPEITTKTIAQVKAKAKTANDDGRKVDTGVDTFSTQGFYEEVADMTAFRQKYFNTNETVANVANIGKGVVENMVTQSEIVTKKCEQKEKDSPFSESVIHKPEKKEKVSPFAEGVTNSPEEKEMDSQFAEGVTNKHEEKEKDSSFAEGVTNRSEEKEKDIPFAEGVPNKPEKKDSPFSEGVTDRQEKLRKLKELLKEQKRAVDEIRSARSKSPDK